MKTLPIEIRDEIKTALWSICDNIGWLSLPDVERASYYERWTKDKNLGGKLAMHMDARKVRVYIKDTLLKAYVRTRISLAEKDVWKLLDLTSEDTAVSEFIKPHGRRLSDGRIIAWGRSRDWKVILMTVFERAHADSEFSAFGVILLESGKTEGRKSRKLVISAAQRLGIEKILWVD